MKNLLLSSLAIISLAIGLSSCQKEESITPGINGSSSGLKTGNTKGAITSIPSAFTQKVLIEEFTSATSGLSPNGVVKIYDIITSFPNQVVTASIHHNDGMQIGWYDEINGVFYNHSTNSAMINRVLFNGSAVQEMQDWKSRTSQALGNKVSCGLAIQTEVMGNNMQIDVHTGISNTINGDLYLTVYLVEDDVTGSGPMYSQSNAFNLDANHPFYNAGNPIQGFQHDNVLRQVVTNGMGELIERDQLKSGITVLNKYFVDISAYNQSNLSVIAFVHKGGASPEEGQILNVQECAAGATKNWN